MRLVSRRSILALPFAGFGLALGQAPQPKREPDVPFVPTTEEAVDAMLRLAGVKPADVVYDLGCGDGRIVIAAAKLEARGVGIDINPVRINEARANAQKAGVTDKVKFVEEDLFTADFKEATVVTLFLLSSVNERLKPRLLAELRPGTRVVSNTFEMGDWKPEREFTVPGATPDSFLSRRLFLWTIPKR